MNISAVAAPRFDLNAFLRAYETDTKARPAIVCADGFYLSVQASTFHYCEPRRDQEYPYLSVEVGCIAYGEDLLLPYCEPWWDEETQTIGVNPTHAIFPFVPVEVVEAVVNLHGGFARAAWGL